MIQPKISVVTVCYNAVATIENTMLSVINQTYQNVEYIIIDGGSTDGTMDIVNRYKDRITVIVSEPDKGIFDAMNKGIKKATGEWINFMNAGDWFVNKTIISQIFQSGSKCQYAVIYGDAYCDYVDQKRYYHEKAFFERKGYIKPMGICHQAMFVQRNWIPECCFDLSFKLAADYNMIYSIYKNRGRFLYTGNPVVVYDTNGISRVRWKKLLTEEAIIYGRNNSIWFRLIVLKRMMTRFIKNGYVLLFNRKFV